MCNQYSISESNILTSNKTFLHNVYWIKIAKEIIWNILMNTNIQYVLDLISLIKKSLTQVLLKLCNIQVELLFSSSKIQTLSQSAKNGKH